MGRLTVVGCGTVVPEPERAASCYHVELDGSGVLLDCGPGTLQAMARVGIAWSGITDLALTHFHADHLGALPGLFFALRHALHPDRRRKPLDVWGPAGTRTLFRRLSRTLGEYIVDPGFPVRVHELGPGDVIGLEGGPSLSAHATPHTDESLAYRLDGDGGSLGYTGDTGPSESLGPFMSGVSALVCECSLLDEEVSDNHLSPARVAALAAAAEPDILLLTHLYPHLRENADLPALVAAAGYGGEVAIADEGLQIDL